MKTFIVTGIQMRNKGSQAMFLSLRHSLQSQFKDCEVVGFADKYDSPEKYSFTLLPFGNYARFILKYRLYRFPPLVAAASFILGKLRKSDKWRGKIPKMAGALLRADAILDASGYTLGSGWPKESGMRLLNAIDLAKQYNKKMVLLPQSFGPFDWGEPDDAEFLALVKEKLSYPSKIYAREKEGYACLTQLGLDNVELSADMVIRERPFPGASDIFSDYGARKVEYPPANSVGFIINQNVFRIGDEQSVFDLYARMIEELISNGEKVCILNTSTADNEIVESVLERVADRQKVAIIGGEYSSPELIDIISKFKYVVASRYHSVVFAYRSGVPAVILGWASKYDDLAALFQQQDYVFDIRTANADQIIAQVSEMGKKYKEESQRINSCREEVQATSVVEQAMRALEG